MKIRKVITTINNYLNQIASPKYPIAIILMLLTAIILLASHSTSMAAATASGNHAAVFPGVRPSMPFDLSGYIEVPYTATLNPNGGDITIEAWVKPNAKNRNETIIGNGWQTSYWLGFSNSGKLRFTPFGQPGLVDSIGTIQPGVWTHIAVTYDGTTRSYYFNGMLDSQTAAKPGDLTPGSGQFLGVGFDRDDTFNPNYFGGLIDNVRIWSMVRTETQIKDNLFTSFGSPQPGLISEWQLDGDASDPVGGFNGTLKGQMAFTNDGAIPHDVPIPAVIASPILDGFCNNVEYGGTTQVTVDSTSVWLMHTSDDLWICFDDLGASSVMAEVFLDVDYTRRDPAKPEHLLLGVKNNDTLETWQGSGSGSYVSTTSVDGMWDGKYIVCCGEFPTYRAEFRISRDLIKGWHHAIGLALGKTDSSMTTSKLWPALAEYNLPSTWSKTLGNIITYIPIAVK